MCVRRTTVSVALTFTPRADGSVDGTAVCVPGRLPVTETLARDLSAVHPRSIAPWPPGNTNGRLRSTRIDWLVPSGECIVVTYATRRALSPPCPVLSAAISRQDAGPSVDDRCDTVSLIRHDIWRRSTNKRRRLRRLPVDTTWYSVATTVRQEGWVGGRKDERALID